MNFIVSIHLIVQSINWITILFGVVKSLRGVIFDELHGNFGALTFRIRSFQEGDWERNRVEGGLELIRANIHPY